MLLDRFFEKGRAFLGCRYPIMCGAMTWVSDPNLVTAVGKAGGFGLLAGGNAPVDILKEQIDATTRMSDHPFGVNVITLAPVYKDQLDMICDLGCRFIVFAGGIPKKREIGIMGRFPIFWKFFYCDGICCRKQWLPHIQNLCIISKL